jgi:hypothetical protein
MSACRLQIIAKEETLRYKRLKPEQTLCFQVIEKYYTQFSALMAQHDKYLLLDVRSDFDEYLECGLLGIFFICGQ